MQRVHYFSSLHVRGLDPACLLLCFRSSLPTNLLFVLQTVNDHVQTLLAGDLDDPPLHQNYFLIVYTDGALPSNDDDRGKRSSPTTWTSSLTHVAHMGGNPIRLRYLSGKQPICRKVVYAPHKNRTKVKIWICGINTLLT